MHRPRLSIALGLWLAGGVCAAFAEQPPADYRDPELLVIEGAAAFKPREIIDALLWNVDFLQSANPSLPIDAYMATLTQLVEAGYRNAGFPDVRVSVVLGLQPRQVAVKIHEGARCMAGAVEIRGAVTLPIARLVERITQPHPPRGAVARPVRAVGGEVTEKWYDLQGKETALEPAVWAVGKPARFPAPSRTASAAASGDGLDEIRKRLEGFTSDRCLARPNARLYREVSDALKDLGYFFPRFDVEIVPDSSRTSARLVVNVLEELGPTQMGAVEIVGNARHTREQILAYLALKPDALLNSSQCAAIRNRLWRSGRFAKVEVTPQPPSAADKKGRLYIEVAECKGVTPLGQELSEHEQILLRLSEWLADPDRWRSDMVVRLPMPRATVEGVFSPQQGVLATLAKPETTGAPQYAVLVSPQETGFYSPRRGKMLSGPAIGAQLKGQIGLCFVPKQKDGAMRNERAWTVGASWKYDKKISHQPKAFELEISVDPAALISLAHDPDGKHTLRDGVLEVAGPRSRFRVEAATGRLIELWICNEPAAVGSASGEQKTERWHSLTFSVGEFARRVAVLRKATAGGFNEYAAKRPISSVGGFLADETSHWAPAALSSDKRRMRETFRLLFDRQLLAAFDELALRLFQWPDSDFEIPFNEPDQAKGFRHMLAAAGARICGELFPQGSWPWTLARQLVFFVGGQRAYVWHEMQRLHAADDNGPLCDAAAAWLLQSVHAQAAKAFANRGRRRLLSTEFRKDYWLLINEQCAVGKCLRRAAVVFRDLSQQELATMRDAVPPRYAGLFADCVRALRQDRSKPLEVALTELLDALWADGLQQALQAFFEKIDPPARAAKGA